MSPHRRIGFIGFTARHPAGNMMMPDRCQTPEGPIMQTSKRPFITPAIASYAGSGRSNVARMWQTQARKPSIDRPSDLWRAPNAAPGNPPLGEDPPGVFFTCTKGGRGGAEPDPHTCRSRNPSLEDPPQFFGQIFWEKILEIKILAPLVTIFLNSPNEALMGGNGGNGSPYSALRPANMRWCTCPIAARRPRIQHSWQATCMRCCAPWSDGPHFQVRIRIDE